MPGQDGNEYVDWAFMQKFNWSDPKNVEALSGTDLMRLPMTASSARKRSTHKTCLSPEIFDLKEAAARDNMGKRRSQFIVKKDIRSIPTRLYGSAISRLFLNEPMTKRYFSPGFR